MIFFFKQKTAYDMLRSLVGSEMCIRDRCTGVEMFRKLLDEGRAGDNIGALLRGTKKEDVERGQVLCKPGSITPHTNFEGQVYVLSKSEGCLLYTSPSPRDS